MMPRAALPAACGARRRSSSTAFAIRADTISKAFAKRCSLRSTWAEAGAARITGHRSSKQSFGSAPRCCQIAHNVGSSRGGGPRGNALSILLISRSVNRRSPARAFSSTCSAFDDFGITKIASRRRRNRSATWRGVASWSSAICLSRRPPGVRASGNWRARTGCTPPELTCGAHTTGERRARPRAPRDGTEPGRIPGRPDPIPPSALRGRHIEIAHAPGQNFPVSFEFLECFDSIPERVRAAPVQQVTIETVGA